MAETSINSILIAARRKLLASEFIVPLIGTDIGKDGPGGAWDDGWVFRSQDANSSPIRDPANTGTSSIVMSLRDPWSSPNTHNTMAFRQLKFSVFSDQSRSVNEALTASRDAELRCDRVASAIIKEFNDVGNVNQFWPNDTFIPSCLLFHDLQIQDVPNQDGLVEGLLSFALELF